MPETLFRYLVWFQTHKLDEKIVWRENDALEGTKEMKREFQIKKELLLGT